MFMAIGISVINALSGTGTSLADLLFTNTVLVLITYGLEKVWLLRHEASKTIVYEKISLIKPENYPDLLKDLSERTGIPSINRVETGKIDFLKDTCILTVFYDSSVIETSTESKSDNGDDDD